MRTRLGAVAALPLLLAGCSGSIYDVPLPGGADLGSDPYTVQVEFRDALDLVPQSAVKVNDISVGRVSNVRLDDDWTAVVSLRINGDVSLPGNALATIRQTSILGEKFVSLEAPEGGGGEGRLTDGDVIPVARSGENPEIESVLSALSLVLNGGSIDRMQVIAAELADAFSGREPEMRKFLNRLDEFVGTAADSREQIISAIEELDRLATETAKQTDAIETALDDLPAALTTLDGQRSHLVAMLDALNELSSVGTKVIKQSKESTIKDFAALEPFLDSIAQSSNEIVRSLRVLPTLPFPDAMFGGTPDSARAYQMGDYANASITFNTDFSTTVALMSDAERAALIEALNGNGIGSLLAESVAD